MDTMMNVQTLMLMVILMFSILLESLVALLKGREESQIRAVHEPDLDYGAWEARIASGEEK